MKDILFEIGEGQKLQRVDELEQQGKFDDYAVGMYLGKHIRGDYGIIADQVKKENAEILALNSNDREDKTIYSLYEVDDFDIGISTKLGATPEENWTTVMTGRDMDRIFGILDKRLVNDELMRNPEAVEHFAKKEAKVAPAKSATNKKIGRNEPCPCGSGKKYKKCCIDKESSPVQKFDEVIFSDFADMKNVPKALQEVGEIPPLEYLSVEEIKENGFKNVEELSLALQLIAVMERNTYIDFVSVNNKTVTLYADSSKTLLEYAYKLGFEELEEFARNWKDSDIKKVLELIDKLRKTEDMFQGLTTCHVMKNLHKIDKLMIMEFNELMDDRELSDVIEKKFETKMFFSAAMQISAVFPYASQFNLPDINKSNDEYREKLADISFKAGFNELAFLTMQGGSIYSSNVKYVFDYIGKQSESIKEKVNRLGPIYCQIVEIKCGQMLQ